LVLARRVKKEEVKDQQPKKKTKVRPLKRSESEFPLGLTLSLVIILVILFVSLIQQSTQLLNKQYYLCELTVTREALEYQNLNLVNQVNTLESLDRIETMAKIKLGMDRPDFDGRVILFQQKKNLALIE